MFRFFYSPSHRTESRLCCNTPFSSRMAIVYRLTGLIAVFSFGLTKISIQYKIYCIVTCSFIYKQLPIYKYQAGPSGN